MGWLKLVEEVAGDGCLISMGKRTDRWGKVVRIWMGGRWEEMEGG